MTTPEHKPYVSDAENMPEFTWGPLLVGAILGIVYGASSLYLVLKVGMTVSASIPVAVLSITLFRFISKIFGIRPATILENNIVQTTGSAGESIAFGVGVTMPAVMLLGFDMEIGHVMLVALLGGLLGILMMIPLRRALIVKQHGTLKYPEGTACADVLIVGEEGGTNAKTVFTGFGLAFVYQWCVQSFKLWKDTPGLALKFYRGAVVDAEASPALFGVGYIIGPRTASIMMSGGILAALVLTPAIKLFGDSLDQPLFPELMIKPKLISEMAPPEIRKNYILYIGAGAVATGGLISLVQALPLIFGSIRSGLSDLTRSAGDQSQGGKRSERDLPMWIVIAGSIALVAVITLTPSLRMNWVGSLLVVACGFFFATVSSRLTGEIGSSSNPISGMTVATLLLTCLVFLLLGWTTPTDRVAALSVAAIVCIAASNAGTTSQDLKTGFLLGATPKWQQLAILVGAISSSLVIGWTLVKLNDAGTVYTQQDLPAITLPAETVAGLTVREKPRGPEITDTAEYRVWHAPTGNPDGVPQGKYLVADDGKLAYLCDPSINGVITKRDDGEAVQKFDAPKTRLMALIIDGILNQKLPWGLVLIGAFIAIMMQLAGVSALPFAVGVYLPIATSFPIFLGGIARYISDRITGRTEAEGDSSPGVLFSSGYIAGGSVAAILIIFINLIPGVARVLDVGRLFGEKWADESDVAGGLSMLPLLAALIWMGLKKNTKAGEKAAA
ncbi:MAG: oligopeptide transporter, OPT family [Planctomycetes bacterium]|nr:oligopeptide transporter, OPT family [Planctomycetota bacterium]